MLEEKSLESSTQEKLLNMNLSQKIISVFNIVCVVLLIFTLFGDTEKYQITRLPIEKSIIESTTYDQLPENPWEYELENTKDKTKVYYRSSQDYEMGETITLNRYYFFGKFPHVYKPPIVLAVVFGILAVIINGSIGVQTYYRNKMYGQAEEEVEEDLTDEDISLMDRQEYYEMIHEQNTLRNNVEDGGYE